MLDFFRSNKNISNTPSVLSPMGEPLTQVNFTTQKDITS